MEGKYSYYHLLIGIQNQMIITGSRKGMSPFVIECSFKNNNVTLFEKEIYLQTPYINVKNFAKIKKELSQYLEKFLNENYFLAEKNLIEIFLSSTWKPVEFLVHEIPFKMEVSILNPNQEAFQLEIKYGRKKLKTLKHKIEIPNNNKISINQFLKRVLDITQKKFEDFDPNLFNWLF